jgi:hypothetical protein
LACDLWCSILVVKNVTFASVGMSDQGVRINEGPRRRPEGGGG